MDRTQVREALTGPVASVRTAFLKDGEIDWDGLRTAVDFSIAAGSRTVLLTAGDSHYYALSDREISEVTRLVVEQTAGRALVVAADRNYDTRQAREFADFCCELGADVLMLMPPDWAKSCTPQTLACHYATVSATMPVMLVTNVFIPRGDAFGLQVVDEAMAAGANVVAVKDDMCGAFARKLALRVHEVWAVIAGGQKQNHMNMHPYGCDGYLSTFITFKPDVAHRYWAAIQAGNLPAATKIIETIDLPFFDLVAGMPGGFDAGIHGVLELFGICRRWRRPPYYSLTEEDMERLGEGLKRIGVLRNS